MLCTGHGRDSVGLLNSEEFRRIRPNIISDPSFYRVRLASFDLGVRAEIHFLQDEKARTLFHRDSIPTEKHERRSRPKQAKCHFQKNL